MKPFQFPLESVRTLREHKEQQARERYAAALRFCEAAAARAQVAGDELSRAWSTLREKFASGGTGSDLARARAWCQLLELRLKERTLALEQARHAVDAVWQELMLATRDRETLDKLFTKRLAAYELDFQRSEQKRFDEMAVQVTRAPLGGRLLSESPSPEL